MLAPIAEAQKILLFPRLYPFRVEPEGLSLVMAGVGNPHLPPFAAVQSVHFAKSTYVKGSSGETEGVCGYP